MDLPSAFPALAIALKGSVVQMFSNVREYTVLPPQSRVAVVFAALVNRDFAVEFSIHFIEEGFKAVVYGFAVQVSNVVLQVRPADCASP